MVRFKVPRTPIFGLLAAWLVLFGTAAPGLAAEVYDLLFKTGTLDGISRTSVLDYERQVSARDNKDLAARETGTISLSFGPDEMAELMFRQGDKHRNLGSFPATVGNPMIMYFVETVVRDMASTAGGSPYYIRNRVKAALVKKVPIREETIRINGQDIPARSVTLFPFEGDPNREKMHGFEDLALTITMSDQVPGWYYELKAETGEEKGTDTGKKDDTPVYSSSIVLAASEAVQ
ncbi:hypothetical protein [uncultured Roseibium sp.]|uniref:hypothetical protein n=1 Tax=uncultured Roseibium sp. TaxID=1936171 RepID=UPI0032170B40